MLQEIVQAVTAAVGIGGFVATVVQARHLKGEEQISVAARRRQFAAKSLALKEKYGSFALLSAFAFSIPLCTLVCLLPLLGLAAFPRGSLWSIISTFGILLWVRYGIYQFVRRLC